MTWGAADEQCPSLKLYGDKMIEGNNTYHPNISRLWDVLFNELKLPPSTGEKGDAVYALSATLMLLVYTLYAQEEGVDLSLQDLGQKCKDIFSDIVWCRENEHVSVQPIN
jgi:hypothetical protein